MLLAVIAACESRLLGPARRRSGDALPAPAAQGGHGRCWPRVPLVDVVMLVASVIDIRRGGEPSFSHSLAAIFIGVSVGFGHQTLKWADSGPRTTWPVRPARSSRRSAARSGLAASAPGWFRHLLAYVVGVGIMIGLGLLSGRGTTPLLGAGVHLDDRAGHRRDRLVQLRLRRRRRRRGGDAPAEAVRLTPRPTLAPHSVAPPSTLPTPLSGYPLVLSVPWVFPVPSGRTARPSQRGERDGLPPTIAASG